MKRSAEKSQLTRRNALGFLAGSVVVVGCGGSSEAVGSGGAAGSGATGATGGASTGGTGGVGAGGSAGASTGGASTGGAPAGGGSAGQSVGGAAGSSSTCGLGTPTPGCIITDDNILGPFYKAGAPFKTDLTDGSVGTPLLVSGTVYGCDCVTPLADAVVDVWQADDGGAYDAVGYVLRGQMKTGTDGKYAYSTILPGFYLNGAQYRPRHIHYKVSHPSGIALTTQLYFEGDPYIPIDPFVKPGLVKQLTQDSGAVYHCTFDIVLA